MQVIETLLKKALTRTRSKISFWDVTKLLWLHFLHKNQIFDQIVRYLPVDWLVDTVVSVCTEQQGPPTSHGASSWHPIQPHREEHIQFVEQIWIMGLVHRGDGESHM